MRQLAAHSTPENRQEHPNKTLQVTNITQVYISTIHVYISVPQLHNKTEI